MKNNLNHHFTIKYTVIDIYDRPYSDCHYCETREAAENFIEELKEHRTVDQLFLIETTQII